MTLHHMKVSRVRPIVPWDDATWCASYTVGYDGNYERALRYFYAWQDAYEWAFAWQTSQLLAHRIRIGRTNCGCSWCTRLCRCGLGTAQQCVTETWGCGLPPAVPRG